MATKELKTSLLISAGSILMLLFAGAITFSYLEGWSFLNAFYFVTMTAMTVGFGDFAPTSDLSRAVTVVYAMSIVPFMLYLFSLVAQLETSHLYKKMHSIERKQEEHEEDIKEAHRKIREQRHEIKEQEEDLEKQKRKLKQESRINQKQDQELDVQEKEIGVQEQELDVVEDIVEDVLEKKRKKE